MALSARSTTTVGLHAALLVLLAGAGCVDIVGADLGRAKYVERDEKHFPVTGSRTVVLGTFDGSIEIRTWDKPGRPGRRREARAATRTDVASIVVQAAQNGDRVEVTVTEPKQVGGFNLHFGNRSAKLIVSLPRRVGRLQPRAGTGRSTSSR